MRLMSLLILCAAACTPAVPPPAAPTAGGQGDSLTGTLRVVGSVPVNVRLVLQDASGSTTIGGELEPELRRLAGAEVVLTGRRQGASFTPTSYQVRSINGEPVTLGTVLSVSGGYLQLRTDAGEIVYLVASPAEIRVGQKVWIQGPRALIVQTFGIVRP